MSRHTLGKEDNNLKRIVIWTGIVILFISALLFSSCAMDYIWFYSNKTTMNHITDLICIGEIQIDEHGWASIPPTLVESGDNKPVILVEYHDKCALFFFSFDGGILGDSKGFLHVLSQDYQQENDIWENVSSRFRIINVKAIESDWYICSVTDG